MEPQYGSFTKVFYRNIMFVMHKIYKFEAFYVSHSYYNSIQSNLENTITNLRNNNLALIFEMPIKLNI